MLVFELLSYALKCLNRGNDNDFMIIFILGNREIERDTINSLRVPFILGVYIERVVYI